MSQGNVGWSPRRTRKRDDRMEVFDSLPPGVRQAYANAAFDWAVANTPKMVMRYGSRLVIESIAKSDSDKIAADRTRVWGWSNVEAGLADLGLD